MDEPRVEERVLRAPEMLGVDTWHEFRRTATDSLEAMSPGRGRLVVDLGGTREVDSAGLRALVLVRRRAAARRQTVRLRGLTEELRYLLVLAKLEHLFEIEPPGG